MRRREMTEDEAAQLSLRFRSGRTWARFSRTCLSIKSAVLAQVRATSIIICRWLGSSISKASARQSTAKSRKLFVVTMTHPLGKLPTRRRHVGFRCALFEISPDAFQLKMTYKTKSPDGPGSFLRSKARSAFPHSGLRCVETGRELLDRVTAGGQRAACALISSLSAAAA
jgi:hypothetical protein